MFAKITGVGSYIPESRVPNSSLEKIIPTTDAWIRENIGVSERSVMAPTETITDMGVHAAKAAMAMAGAPEIGLVICATNSPDTLYPATACRISHALEIGNAPAYDLQAGCTGFLYALTQARAFVETQHKAALVIGSDALSTGFNWHGDRNAVLFGDAAGAVVLAPSDAPGILSAHIGAEFSDAIELKTPFASSLNSPLNYLAGETKRRDGEFYTTMNGRAIMKLSLTHVPRAIDKALADAKISKADVSWFLPHQSNKHVIAKLCDHIGFDKEKVPHVLEPFGSLSTAVMPVSLAMVAPKVKSGEIILMTAYGAGFTYGASVMRW